MPQITLIRKIGGIGVISGEFFPIVYFGKSYTLCVGAGNK